MSEKEDQIDKETLEKPAWKSYREVQDIRNGVNNLNVRYDEHKSLKDSMFSNWKELYSFAVRIATSDSIPIWLRGDVATIMLVLMKGEELQMELTDSLYNIVPLKGFMVVRINKLMEMILGSDVVDTWEEKSEGTFSRKNFKYSVRTKRLDNGATKTITFGFNEMKQAGLYISPELYDQIKTGLTKSQEIRFRYPERVCEQIAKSWLCRDIYPDVCKGLRAAEEVETYDNYEKVLKENGDLVIAGKPIKVVAGSQKRNERLLDTLDIAGDLDTDKDGRLKTVAENSEDLLDSDSTELFDTLGKVREKEKYTRDEIYSLKGSKSKHLRTILTYRGIMMDFLPKATTDQRRELILAHQEGWNHFKKYIKETFGVHASEKYDDMLRSTKPEEKKIHTPAKDIKAKPSNRYNIKVPDKHSGTAERTIEEALDLKSAIENFVIEDEKRFLEMVDDIKAPSGDRYKSIIQFCRIAEKATIDAWLDRNHN